MPKIEVKWIFLLLFVMVGIQAQTQTQSQAPAPAEAAQDLELSVICRNKKEVRTLRVEKDPSGKCTAIYTKLGRDQNIGLASNESSCTEILRKVRVNLEAADWKCREIKESRVSNLIEM